MQLADDIEVGMLGIAPYARVPVVDASPGDGAADVAFAAAGYGASG